MAIRIALSPWFERGLTLDGLATALDLEEGLELLASVIGEDGDARG